MAWAPPSEAFKEKSKKVAWAPPIEAIKPAKEVTDDLSINPVTNLGGALAGAGGQIKQGLSELNPFSEARHEAGAPWYRGLQETGKGLKDIGEGAFGLTIAPWTAGSETLGNLYERGASAVVPGQKLFRSGDFQTAAMAAGPGKAGSRAFEKIGPKPKITPSEAVAEPGAKELELPIQRETPTPPPAAAAASKWTPPPEAFAKLEAKQVASEARQPLSGFSVVKNKDYKSTMFPGADQFHVKDVDGKHVTTIIANQEGDKIQVHAIGGDAKGATQKGQLGTSVMRKILPELQKQYPSATSIGGTRITGARARGVGKGNISSKTTEVSLRPGDAAPPRSEAPPVPTELRRGPVPADSSGTGGVALQSGGQQLVAQQRGGGPRPPEPPLPGDGVPHSGGATPSLQAIEQAAQGKVDRFVLRDMANIFHRMQGREDARQVEVGQHVEANKAKIGSDLDRREYEYGEGKPGARIEPHEEAEAREGQRWDGRNTDLYKAVQKMAKKRGFNKEFLADAQELNPKYMHRITLDSVKKYLGQSQDAHLGYSAGPGKFGMYKASATKPRKFFGIESSGGSKGIVYVKGDSVFAVRKHPVTGETEFKKLVNLPKDFESRPGAEFGRGKARFRLTHAITDDIEKATNIKYIKSAIVSRALNYLQLSKMHDHMQTMEEVTKFLGDRNLASSSAKSGWSKTDYPGLGHMYYPERVARYLDKMKPRQHDDENAWNYIARLSQTATASLFWNPIIHFGNVAAHAVYERGWKYFQPSKYKQYPAHFMNAFKAVSTQNKDYQNLLSESARLMYGPRKAYRELHANMFANIEELHTPEGQTKLSRFAKLVGDVPPAKLIKSIYRHSGDALWFMGDVLTMTAMNERMAARPAEGMRASVRQIHKDLPSYRIPKEEILPGKAGRLISDAMTNPVTRTFLNFIPYHENVMRGLTTMAEDVIQGTKSLRKDSPRAAENRQDAVDALGKIVAIGGAYLLYKGADEITKGVTGDEDVTARRFGPFAFLSLLDDQLSDKHLTEGSKARLATGGLFSPSPVTEGMSNVFGAHAFSMSPIQPEGDPSEVKYHMRAGDVPYDERLGAMAGSAVAPLSQINKLYESGITPSSALEFAGLLGHTRKTQEELDQAKEDRRNARR